MRLAQRAEQEEAPSRRLLGPARACRDGNRTALHARMLSFTALRRLCQQPRVSLGIDLVCSRPAVVVPKLRVARPTMVATRRSGSSSSSSSSGSGSTSSEDHCKGAGVKRTPPQPSQARKRKTPADPPPQSTPIGSKAKAPTKKTRAAPRKQKEKQEQKQESSTAAAAAAAPESVAPPKGWREQYQIVQELRAILDAPVDEFGSEALPERNVPPAVFRYQVLIALMLSSQTRDQVVGAAIRKLQAHGLTVENILRTDDELLRSMLFGVGFYNNKTKHIKQTSQILVEQHGGDVPSSAKELCALPGIGPKMAYIILNVAHGVVTGIGIDTHMHRIMNQLCWMKTKTPEQTRAALESWLPKEEWDKINLLFVGFGQQIQTEPTKLLSRACGCSDPPSTFRLLRQVGVDINVRETKDKKRTALMQVAARSGGGGGAGATGGEAMSTEQQLQCLRCLIAEGAKVQLQDADGQTAEHLAGAKTTSSFSS